MNVSYSANAITITALPAGSPFQTWIGNYPSIPVADRDPLDDPDNDGYSNLEEFALGGDPSSGSNNARIYSIVADGNVDGDANKELLMTIAVRTGTPAFTAGPQPVATTEGITYAIQGSETLGNFMSPVTPVGMVAPAVPAPAGYEFRTFSLDASNGMPSKGFLRVKVSN